MNKYIKSSTHTKICRRCNNETINGSTKTCVYCGYPRTSKLRRSLLYKIKKTTHKLKSAPCYTKKQ